MSPKFRGGSDDWMDDQDTRSGTVRKNKKGAPPPARARELDPSLANAIVAEVFPKQARVRFDQDGREVVCNYRMAALIDKGAEVRERSPVAVGDRVQVDGDIITGLCTRRNRLVRPAPDRDLRVLHVLVSNIDRLVIVASAMSPDFSPGLVDRFLVAARAQLIEPILCINKVDLWTQNDRKPWEIYRELGIELVESSAKKGNGVEDLRKMIDGKVAAFCGHSGVGKTSLLRTLHNADVGKVGEVSASTGKGRHTTTGALLLPGLSGAAPWIDTPGIREFGLVDVDPNHLIDAFPELKKVASQCVEFQCRHAGEQGCAAAILERAASYRRIYESLVAGEN